MSKEQEKILCELCEVNDLNEVIKGIGCSADEIKIIEIMERKGR